MITDAQKSIKAILYERVTSPVLGAFSISWALSNWKVWLICLDPSLGAQDKIEAITKATDAWHSIECPLLMTIVLAVIYPFISIGSAYIWEFSKSKLRSIRHSYDSRNLLTLEQSIAIRREINRMEEERKELFRDKKDIEKSYQVLIQSEKDENEKLKVQITELERKLLRSKNGPEADLNENKTKIVSPSTEEGKVLSAISKFDPEAFTMDDLNNQLKLSKQKIKYHIDRFEERGWIRQLNEEYFELTSEGRKLVIEQLK
jgi:DNA-binding MarR family transcriptional regulator